ncbi:hypothetical protein [Levilactobacillus brevis]|uniref:hypothetical protein n=1 Tax=Levilactobacillus brevis TaxID=1580 RepID=UPI003513BD1C
MTSKSDFEKITAYLFVLSVGVGLYPMQIVGEFMRDVNSKGEVNQPMDIGIPNEVKEIYGSWTEKEESAFLIYFGSACMKAIEEGKYGNVGSAS